MLLAFVAIASWTLSFLQTVVIMRVLVPQLPRKREVMLHPWQQQGDRTRNFRQRFSLPLAFSTVHSMETGVEDA